MKLRSLIVLALAAFLGFPNDSIAQGLNQPYKRRERVQIQQHYDLDRQAELASRVERAMPETFRSFREAGMDPREHQLTAAERLVVKKAFAELPRLYRDLLREHLLSISFMDNMPNTALTSTVNPKDDFRLYNITFRAEILHQTVTEWLTWKERTCFDTTGSDLSVSIRSGGVNALTYLLMHEATHVLDLSLNILGTDKPGSKFNTAFPGGSFVKGVWIGLLKTDAVRTDTLFLRNRFHSGGDVLPVAMAKQVYESLGRSPFVSLYSTASWGEDLAEYISIYHLTQIQKQPFQIIVSQKGKEIFRLEPMRSGLVRSRMGIVRGFYR